MKWALLQDFHAEDTAPVLRFLELFHKPAAVVSEDLMVLEQTVDCELLLDHGRFFPLTDWLARDVCREIADCIRLGQAQMLPAEAAGVERLLRVIPAEERALLIFDELYRRVPALLLDAARMRESAAMLLHTADQLDCLPDGLQAAARVRREAMRLLRQAKHGELLGGGTVPLECSACDLSALAEGAAEELRARGFSAQADGDRDAWLTVDERLVQEAVLTLASNSIRFGGPNVHIFFRVQRGEDGVIFRVEDDGPGLSRQAIARMEEGWSREDSPLPDGEWGFGIPFASRVAQLHGGRLHYLYGTSGCTACLTLRDGPENGLGLPVPYAGEQPGAAEIELSAVLGAEEYKRS